MNQVILDRINETVGVDDTLYILGDFCFRGKRPLDYRVRIACQGVKSIIGSGCVLNVEHFFQELHEIKSSGIDACDLVKIAKNTHIITAEHINENNGEEIKE